MHKKKYIIFYKPYGVLSQFTSEINHKTLADFGLPKEVYPVGRLDKDSEGLLLLSNDGPFIKNFLDNHEREYLVQVEKIPDEIAILKLQSGIVLDFGKTKPCKVQAVDEPKDLAPRIPPVRFRKNIPTSWLKIILKEGKNRQVRRMTAAVGFPTLRLIRIGLGKFKLHNFIDFKEGEWKEVSLEEII